jgi:hypothetical protein
VTLTLTSASLATVEELFEFKAKGFELPPFPGYSPDQWGIKAHNRPWVAETARFRGGQRVVEIGGAYSRLPEYLASTFGVEAWIADDFGMNSAEAEWSRWGDPRKLPGMFPSVRYVFKRMGQFAPELPDAHFDRVFSVSTLEHIPASERLRVFRDMNRITARGGVQLHTVDVPVRRPKATIAQWAAQRLAPLRLLDRRLTHEVAIWFKTIAASGVEIRVPVPSVLDLLDRRVLVDSPDVVYRFYPPNDAPKPFVGMASLLLVIEDL